MSFSKRGQRLGDMVGRTVVVKVDFVPPTPQMNAGDGFDVQA